jgi:hydroxysqualene synthase
MGGDGGGGFLMKNPDMNIRAAYAECRKLARRHYENFPVASRLVPSDKRDALAAIYAFARGADDLADQPKVSARLERLAEWRANLRACVLGEPGSAYPGVARSLAGEVGPVFLALGDTVRRFALSEEHFENLLRAFESDVRQNRHPNFDSLLAYSSGSANPVGRLVLELFGHRDARLFELSDSICTALQLTNFWQDVGVDLARDRVYVPMEDLARFGVSLDALRDGRLDEGWRRLMAIEVRRTRELFERGRGLPEKVVPELRRQLRLTWLGGTTILERIEAADFDVFNRRPKLTRLDFARLYWRARRPLEPLPSAEHVEPKEPSRAQETRAN